MAYKKPLSPEQIEELLLYRMQGKTIAYLSSLYGLTPTVIRKYMDRARASIETGTKLTALTDYQLHCLCQDCALELERRLYDV